MNDNAVLSSNKLDYKYFFYSPNEKMRYAGSGPINIIPDYSSPTNACGGTSPGVNGRQYITTPLETVSLSNRLDSLRRDDLTTAQQTRLLKGIRNQPAQTGQVPALEALLLANTLAPSSQQAIGLHLLQYYRAQHDAPNTTRLREWLQQHALTDAELKSYLTLTQFNDQSGSFLPGLRPLASANRALLSKVVMSGTTSARLACRLLRAYEPTCACVLPKDAPAVTKAAPATPQKEATVLQPLTAYPNPANTLLRVLYNLPSSGYAAEIQAYDILGRVVLHQPLSNLQGEAEVNVQHWPTGLYHFTLVAGGRVQGQQRIVITH